VPLDPQARATLDAVSALGLPPFEQGTPAAARAGLAARRKVTTAAPAPVHAVEERRAGGVPVRVYRPSAARPLPSLVYFHGGGWVLGDLDVYDGTVRDLANASGCLVVSVDYRLAPEHKFPAAADDAFAATAWVADNAAEIGADPERLAVGGDSAGGNLAAAVTLMARGRGGPKIAFQLLIYPVTDQAFDTVSYQENAEGYGLTRKQMMWFSGHYLRSPVDADDPLASPLRASSLRGLPPALVITAGYDPLRDEAEQYAERLKADGVDVRVERYPGLIHGFFGMTASIDAAGAAIRRAGDALRSALR
jgi:acetyl esterase